MHRKPGAARARVCIVLFAFAACAQTDNDAAPAATDSGTAAPSIAAPCTAEPDASDRTLCVPERVGPVRISTTRAQLDSLFPPELSRDEPVDVGEGMTEPGTLINGGRADSARIVWADSARTRIAQIVALGPAWRTPEGLGVGSSLAEIAQVLGPVGVLGFGWDYGGTVMLGGTRLANSGLFFRTLPRSEGRGTAAYNRVRGDSAFAADDPDVRELDPVVRRVDVIWR